MSLMAAEGVNDMQWETKLQALNALVECSLKMRKPGDWYVSQQIDIKDNSVLKSICGSGVDPESAVCDHWNQATIDLKSHEYVIARTYRDGDVNKRLAVRWNGFMWDHIEEQLRTVAA